MAISYLALWGDDPPDFHRTVRAGDTPTVLPLDVTALNLARRTGFPVRYLDEFLGEGAILRAREVARRWERTWFEPARADFTVDGICWPELDRQAWFWFWQSVALSIAVAEKIQQTPGASLAFFAPPRDPRPARYYEPSDVPAAIWTVLLGSQARPIPPAQPTYDLKTRLRRHWQCRAKQLRSILRWPRETRPVSRTRLPQNLAALRGSIVWAVHHGEVHRFAGVIKASSTEPKQPVQVVMIEYIPDAAQRFSRELKVTFWPGPEGFVPPAVEAAVQFDAAVNRSVTAASPALWQDALRALPFHFHYYCHDRWPRLVAAYRYWSDLWQEHRPAAVVTSAVYGAESLLPAVAARQLGIPTLAVPHGAMMRGDDLVASDKICYSTRALRVTLEQAGIPPERFEPTRGLVAHNEYPVVPPVLHGRGTHCRILVLLEPSGYPGCLVQCTRFSQQLRALQSLRESPPDLSGRYELLLKTHPWITDRAIIEAADPQLAELVLPANTDLHSVLPATDLVVALNYYGSALVHVLRAGKPVILYWNDREAETFTHGAVWLQAGELAQTADEFWTALRRFLTDAEAAQQLTEQAKTFARDYLDDNRYPSLAEVIQRALADSPTHAPLNPRETRLPVITG